MTMMKITDIRIDGGTQPRAKLDEPTVADYAAALADGASLPPVIVFHDGSEYWLADGFHRYHAHRRVGRDEIAADVHNGTRRDAVLFAVGANDTHGLRRSNEDKRRAVQTLLADAEWAQWSDREIARRCAVGHQLVAAVRQERRDELDESVPESAIKTVVRGGATYRQNTSGIATANRDRAYLDENPDSKPPAARPTKAAKSAEQEEHEAAMEEVAKDFDPIAELEAAQREIAMLNARIKAMSVDDTGKELAKQIEIRQGIEGRLAQETTKVHELDRQLRRMGKVMEELRKLTGAESNSGIVPAVRALVRKAA